MTVKISAKLPDSLRNGLTAIEDELTGDGEQRQHVVVALVTRHSRTISDEDDSVTPTVAFTAIEVVKEDLSTLARILRRAKETRLGGVVLPFDTEAELEAVFENVDLLTGEVIPPTSQDDGAA
jgi:hypothetical protein